MSGISVPAQLLIYHLMVCINQLAYTEAYTSIELCLQLLVTSFNDKTVFVFLQPLDNEELKKSGQQ